MEILAVKRMELMVFTLWNWGDVRVDVMVQVVVCIPSCCNLLDFDHS